MADKKFKDDLKLLPQAIGKIIIFIIAFYIIGIIISPIVAILTKTLTKCFGFFWNLI